MKESIDINKNQILVFTSPCAFPVWKLVLHAFIVINQKGTLTRLDVLHVKKPDGSHVYVNHLTPTDGLPIIWPFKKFLYKSTLHTVIDIEESEVNKIMDVIKSPSLYPFFNQYQFLGHNCNTFAR